MANDIQSKSVNIYIDDMAAQQALLQLQQKADGFNKKIDEGRQKQKDFLAQIAAAKDAGKSTATLEKNYAGATKSIQQSTDSLKKNEAAQKSVQQQIDSKSGPSLKQQQALVSKLWNEYKLLGQNTEASGKKLQEYVSASKGLDQIKARLNGITDAQHTAANEGGKEGGLAHIFGRVAEYTGIYEIITKVTSSVKEFFSTSFEEANAAQEAVDGISKALENAGRGDLLKPFLDAADTFADKYKRLDNDDITNVFTKLIDYGKLSKNQINSLTDTIINYAAKEKITLQESADVFTTALEGKAGPLKRYGVNLKDAGSVTERFAIIQGQLATKIQGAEAALEQTNQGVLDIYKQKFRDMAESVGKFLYSLTGIEKQSFRNAVAAKQEATEGQSLVNRYEELSKKVNKTTAEKQEMQRITASLTATFGNSVVSIDKETGALKLNVEATKDLIKQKLLLANSKAAEIAAKYNAALDDQKNATDQLAISQQAYNVKVQETGITFEQAAQRANKVVKVGDDVVIQKSKYSDAEKSVISLGNQIRDLTSKQNDASASLKEYAKQLKELGFSEADVQKLFNPTPTDPNAPVNKNGGDPNDNTDAENKYKALLEKAEAFNKKIRDLKQQSEDASKTQDQKEIDDAKHKYDEILIEYQALVKELAKYKIHLGFDEKDLTKLEQDELAGILAKQKKKHEDELAKQRIANAETEYAEALRLSDAGFEEKKKQQAEFFIAGQIDEKQYQANIAAIDVKAKENQLLIAQDYANQKVTVDGKEVALVKQADADLTKFKKENLEKQTADLLAEYAKREQVRKLLEDLEKQTELSHAQNQVAIAAPNSKAQLKAQENLLGLQHKQLLDSLEEQRTEKIKAVGLDNEAIAKINNAYDQQQRDAVAKYEGDKEALHNTHILSQINADIAYAQQALSIVSTFLNAKAAREQADLQRELAQYDAKKAADRKLYNNKIISQQEYNKLVADEDEKAAKKKHELDVKQFERNKKLQIAQALMNGASAVTKILAEYPKFDFGVATAIGIGLALATTAAEVVEIGKQKAPEFEKGGIATGSRHSEGGIAMIDSKTGRKVGEMEDGEPYMILSRNTYSNNKQVIDSLLESSTKRNGAKIEPWFKTQPYRRFDYGGVTKTIQNVRYYANGGVFQQQAAPAPASEKAPVIVSAISPEQESLMKEMLQYLKTPKKSYVVLSEIQAAGDQLDSIQYEATFK
jgi:hypothetical protein